MSEPDLSKFEQRIAQRRREKEAEERRKQAEQAAAGEFDSDLIPDLVYDKSEASKQMDSIIADIDILTAYIRWCGKMIPVQKAGQVEGIKISCPIPGHNDVHPSAWANVENNTWFCGGCNEGGDVYDLAAIRYGGWAFGNPKPYKDGAEFHKLREQMARDFGYTISETPGGNKVIVPPISEPEPTEPVEVVEEPHIADVIQLREPDDDEPFDMPSLDWRPICPENTFLHEYMKATCIDDAPEEYHFVHGLLAIGFALGRDVALFDSIPIYGNLFVCTLGRTGIGKSKAKRHLDDLLGRTLPFDLKATPSKGVKRVNAPGSAESLVYNFMAPVEDPANPKRIAYYAPVRGIVDFNELSSLVARGNRQGSALKPTLMQFYDMETRVETHSMTTGAKTAERPFASVVTTSQPAALQGLLDRADIDSGFLNRWVFVPGTEKRRYSVGGARVDVSPAVDPLQRIVAWASTFKTNELIEWSQEAYSAWDKFFHDTLEPLRKEGKSPLLVRIDLTLKKLMLLFAANRHEKVLSEQSVADALYMFQFLKAAYGVPEAQIGNSQNNEIAEVLQAQFRKYGSGETGVTMRKVWENIKHKKYDRKRVMDVLATLVKMGLVEEVQVNQGKVGRPTTKYRMVAS